MNKLYQFWQELKRRNVVRRNTVYAATAFVILELTSIIQQPLRLPDWTLTFVIIALSIGLVISVIFSWIYEVDPEQGLVRTRPAPATGEGETGKIKDQGWKVATYVSLVVIAGLIMLNIFSRPGPEKIAPNVERSIAVLPLENLSTDSSQVYFCEAMREEILNHLYKVESFSVRSRTSTDRYRNTDKTSIEIGEELHVNYLVEGSVGLDNNMIRIWLQLIDARTDEHLWADDFTREKKEIFTLQSEIASALSRELQTTLTPEEIEKIERSPTDNPEAYQAYLRGNYYANQPHDERNLWQKALENYQEAVALDSSFGLAWAALAKTHAIFRYYNYDLSEDNLEEADRAAEKALNLGAEDPEVHIQLGYYYLYGYQDSEQQSMHWEIASRELPNNPDLQRINVELMKARYIRLRDQGKWELALNEIEKAAKLDPNDVQIFTRMGNALWFTRRYAAAVEAFSTGSTVSPDANYPPIGKVWALLSWKGLTEETERAVANTNPQENYWTPYIYFWNEAGRDQFDEALRMASDTTGEWMVKTAVFMRPKSLYRAFIYRYLEKDDEAAKNFRDAAALLEDSVHTEPLDFRYHATLGIAYAALGKREAALAEMERSIELKPLGENGMYGTSPQFDAILVYLYLGDMDRAMKQFEYMLSIPSPYTMMWPEWYLPLAPLKEQPGFAELQKKYPIQ